jgi:hypothetical protein
LLCDWITIPPAHHDLIRLEQNQIYLLTFHTSICGKLCTTCHNTSTIIQTNIKNWVTNNLLPSAVFWIWCIHGTL